jgi:hypothetical protein
MGAHDGKMFKSLELQVHAKKVVSALDPDGYATLLAVSRSFSKPHV